MNAKQFRKWFLSPFIISFIFLFTCLVTNAQNISAVLTADSSHILIGDYTNIKLTVKFSTDFTILLPSVTDSVGNMELIKASKIDTAVSGNQKTISETFTVSAYDSGQYHAGPEKIIFKNKSGLIDSLFSNYVFIRVNTVPADTSKPFRAIVAPLEVPFSWKEFMPYIIGGIILLALIAVGIYFLLRRKKGKPAPVERPKPKDPAHIWARKELKKLEEEKLWQKDDVKIYFSRLTDILRLYLEYRYDWFALEATTEEINEQIVSYNISPEAKTTLLQILTTADLVKFAKLRTMPDVNTKAMDSAYKFIDLTEEKEVRPEVKNV